MAQPNGQNPTFPGKVTAQGFDTPYGMTMRKVVSTNGATPVNVFGSTNGFAGTVVMVKVTAKDDSNGTIDLAGSNGTIARVVKGSAGQIRGSYIGISGVQGTTFASSGTLTVSSNSGSGDALVEVSFTVA